jgi:hypothetical protein
MWRISTGWGTAIGPGLRRQGGGPPIHPTIPDGVGTMQVLEAAKRSAATGATIRL